MKTLRILLIITSLFIVGIGVWGFIDFANNGFTDTVKTIIILSFLAVLFLIVLFMACVTALNEKQDIDRNRAKRRKIQRTGSLHYGF